MSKPIFSHDLAEVLMKHPNVPLTLHVGEQFTKTVVGVEPVYFDAKLCTNNIAPYPGKGTAAIGLILSD